MLPLDFYQSFPQTKMFDMASLCTQFSDIIKIISVFLFCLRMLKILWNYDSFLSGSQFQNSIDLVLLSFSSALTHFISSCPVFTQFWIWFFRCHETLFWCCLKCFESLIHLKSGRQVSKWWYFWHLLFSILFKVNFW